MSRHVRQHTRARSAVLRTSAMVVLAHAGVIWLITQGLDGPNLTGSSEQVILASVVSDIPAPTPVRMQTASSRARATAEPVRPAPQATEAVKASAAVASTDSPTAASAASAGTTPSSTSAGPAMSTAAAVVLPSSDADYLHNPPPAYPRMSRRLGEQGTVLVRVLISTEGRAEKAEIRSSSGYPRLDEAALETVQRWRYVPGQRAGKPEAMWFSVPIRFVLD